MATSRKLGIRARIEDHNVAGNALSLPPGRVQRWANFEITLDGRDVATIDALFVGQRGRPLMIQEVTRDDFNLEPQTVMELATAIYQGHYSIKDHDQPVTRSVLTGEINVEPYWESVVLEKFTPAI